MRKFFIYLFHGHTDDDLNSYMSQMSQHALRYERIIDDLRSTVKELKEDNKYLRDLIFKDKGVIAGEPKQFTKEQHDAISLSRPSWPRVKAKLEAQDLARFNEMRKGNPADITEAYWTGKMEQELNEEAERIDPINNVS
jgi:hypothetical protein